MGSKQKTGAYQHFCAIIIAQGKWSESDFDSVRSPLLEKRRQTDANEYGFFLKLTHRTKIPMYSDCHLCQPIYEWLTNLKGQMDGIIYQGHHYLTEEDKPDLITFLNLILSNNRVKKLYILYIDSLSEIRRNEIKSMDLVDLKNIIKLKKTSMSEFNSILENNDFKERIIYKIGKDSYYKND